MAKAVFRFPFRLLRMNRDVRYLWIGETTSHFGDMFYDVAIMWYVFARTGSGLDTGLVLIAAFVPQVMVGPILGVLADRMDRKLLMQVASGVQALLTGALALLVFTHRIALWEIYAVTVLMSVVALAYSPARAGLFPELVRAEDLLSGNAMFTVSLQVARVVGSTAGGTLVALAGAPLAIAFDALTFVVSAALLAPVRARPVETASEPESAVARDLQAAWQWLRRQKALLVLIIIGALSNIALGPSNVLSPMLVRDVLHAGAPALGIFDASIGMGVVVGGLVIGSLPSDRVGTMFLAGIGLEGLALSIISMAHAVFIAYAGNFVLGLGVVAANLPTTTLFQTLVPDSMRGRIAGLGGMLGTVTIPLSYGGVGILGDTIGARGCFAMAAGLMGSCVSLGLATRDIRHLSDRGAAGQEGVDAASSSPIMGSPPAHP